jgi:hypothetical protein
MVVFSVRTGMRGWVLLVRCLEEVPMISTVVVPLVAVVLTLAGGWLVSTRVSDHWDQIRRLRESDLAAVEEFQRLYGEFFAVWKTWDAFLNGELKLSDPAGAAWDCLRNSAEIEGRVEALLAKISAERELSDDDINVLGAVRQGFQSLRGAIKKEERLPWLGSEVEPYTAFKALAVYTARLLGTPSNSKNSPSNATATENFRGITSNRHENCWPQTAQQLGLLGDTSKLGTYQRPAITR